MQYREKSNSKFLKQILIYFIEILLFTTIIKLIIFGGFSGIKLVDLLKDYVFTYTIYQLILITVFKFKDSFEIDSLTSIKNEFDKYLIYAEFNRLIPESDFDEVSKKLIDNPSITLKNKYRDMLKDLVLNSQQYNSGEVDKETFRFQLKQVSRALDSQIKILGFHWMNSLFLRAFK